MLFPDFLHVECKLLKIMALFLCLFGVGCSERTTPPAPVSYGYEDSPSPSSLASETRARKASPSLKKPAPIEKETLIEEEVVPLQKTQDAESEAEDKNLKARDTEDEESALLPPPQPRRKKLSVAQREKELEAQFSTLDPSEDQDGTVAKKSSKVKKSPSSAKEEAKNEEESSSLSAQEEDLKEKTLSKKEENSSKPLASEAQGEAKEGAPNFIWPVQGKLVMRFNQEKGKVKNDGINIAAPLNTPIKATETGTVVYEGNEMEGFGNLILIKHLGGWMSAYGHCAKILVKRGEKIKRGQTIALVGKTGSVRTPQVHFQLRKKATVVDPVPYLE